MVERRSAEGESEGRGLCERESNKGALGCRKPKVVAFREAKVTGSKARQSKGSADEMRGWLSKAENCKGGCRLGTQKAGEMKGKPRGQLFLGLLFDQPTDYIYSTEGPVM